MAQFPGNQLDRFSRRTLERAGINDYVLCKLDPEEIFVRVLKSQGTANLSLYYNVFGYMIDVDPDELAKDEWAQNRLVKRLKQEGLL